jgi:hypothetical protein
MFADVTAPGRELHERFLSLGDMTGKTANEIVATVGPPTSISSLSEGQELWQWQAIGCHMALLFDAEGRFIGISHQFANYAAAATFGQRILVFVIVGLVTVVWALFAFLR